MDLASMIIWYCYLRYLLENVLFLFIPKKNCRIFIRNLIVVQLHLGLLMIRFGSCIISKNHNYYIVIELNYLELIRTIF